VDNANGNKATVMKLNDNTWVPAGNQGFSSGQTSYTSLAIYNGKIYVAFSDGDNGGKATLMIYTGE
jgi:hypothetical protein